ncbi:TPA: hypothetical protein ACLGZS_005009, partial [Salmonella enterica]
SCVVYDIVSDISLGNDFRGIIFTGKYPSTDSTGSDNDILQPVIIPVKNTSAASASRKKEKDCTPPGYILPT